MRTIKITAALFAVGLFLTAKTYVPILAATPDNTPLPTSAAATVIV